MIPCTPNSLRVRKSSLEGGLLGRFLIVELTVSMIYFKIWLNRLRVGFFSFLRILLFLSFHISQIIKLGMRTQARLRTSLSEKFLLHHFRVLVIVSLSLSDYWKMLEKESLSLEVKLQLLRRCSIVSSWAS